MNKLDVLDKALRILLFTGVILLLYHLYQAYKLGTINNQTIYHLNKSIAYILIIWLVNWTTQNNPTADKE